MRILALNTSHTNALNFKARFCALRDYINRERPEVVLLQEGAGGIAALILYQCWSTLAILKGELPGYGGKDYYSFSTPYPWMQYRNAVFTTLPLMATAPIQTPKVSNEGARTAAAGLTADGLNLVSVHLSSDANDQGRLLEMQIILNELKTSGPVVIGGDFNCGKDSPAWAFLKDQGFALAGFGVDWVAIKGLAIQGAAQMVLDGISDHPGILVNV